MTTKSTILKLAVMSMVATVFVTSARAATVEAAIPATLDIGVEPVDFVTAVIDFPVEIIEVSNDLQAPPQAEVAAPAETVKPIRVAVVDFASASGDSFTSCNVTVSPMEAAGRELSEAVALQMAVWPEYEIVARDEIDRVVKEYKLSKRGLHTPEALETLAEQLDVEVVLVGQTEGTVWSGKGHAGGSLYAALQVLSASDSKVLWSIDGSVTDTESSSQLVPSLAEDMMGRLYAEIRTVESVQSMLAMHTSDR